MGHALGFYRILSLLGAGGMGEVHLAEDPRLGRRVALKILPAEFAQDQARLRWFEKEARATSALNHPNIITIHDIGEADGHPYIATEFIDGETLRRRMSRSPLTVDEALDIGLQVANALAAAHEAGVVHRDIKPENIMLRRDGYVKVLDFGLAKLTQSQELEMPAATLTAPSSRASTGILMGTAGYMSPEQARTQTVDARSDIFSLGVVLYEMLSGHCPFSGSTTGDVFTSILTDEPSLERLGPETPESLKRVIGKSLRKDPRERYQTARELIADLMTLKQKSPRRASSAEYLVGAITRRKWVAVSLVATALLVVAGVRHFLPTADFIDSIAILHFVNEGGDATTEYISDGLSDNLIGRLERQYPNLRVTPFTTALRYKGKPLDAQNLASALNVRSVLMGWLTVRGDALSVRATLVDAQDNRTLWEGQYSDRRVADLLQVQAEISQDIFLKLGRRLAAGQERPLLKPETRNSEAHRLYTHGRYHWAKLTKEGLHRSIELFQEAVGKDPDYALAYSGLADSYSILGEGSYEPPDKVFTEARKYADEALSHDDNLAEAWVSLGMVKLFYEWDWPGAEIALKRAMVINPNSPHALHFYGHYLQIVGRTDEAITYTNQGVEKDMANLFLNAELGWAYLWARQYDAALSQFEKTLDLDRNFEWATWSIAQALEQLGRNEDALRVLNDAGGAASEWSWMVAETGYAHARQGNKAEAEKAIRELKKRAEHEYIDPVILAYIYIALDNKQEALDWLDKALELRSGLLPWLKVEPKFDPLRNEPRFVHLLEQVGLPL
jgi:serine/threonine-protein kinase